MPSAVLASLPRIVCVVATRPDLIKMAPIHAALRRLAPAVALTLVHAGQHDGDAMSAQYFAAVDLPAPDLKLDAGSASHAPHSADIMRRFEPVLDVLAPAAVLVVGGADAALACALLAARKQIAVFHVEAGLRGLDRTAPEEINRVLTDQLSELLLTSEASGMANLRREGIAAQRIHGVGNVLIDSLLRQLPRAVPADITLSRAGLGDFLAPGQDYAVLTLHRPSNVDDPARLAALMRTMVQLSARLPLIFPIHPRTLASLERHGLLSLLNTPRLVGLAPQGYLEMLGLMRGARLVLTDSGGVQDETTALGVPCLTLRDDTERPVTVGVGSNTLVGHRRAAILDACEAVLRGGGKTGRVPDGWDGRAAERIAAAIGSWLQQRRAAAPISAPISAATAGDIEDGSESGTRSELEHDTENGKKGAMEHAIERAMRQAVPSDKESQVEHDAIEGPQNDIDHAADTERRIAAIAATAAVDAAP